MRTQLTIVALLFLAVSVSAQQWALHRIDDTAELRSITDRRITEGFTPVGIDISDELGLTMLYSRVRAWPATAYVIAELDSLEDLNDTVSARIRDGWFPMDFSFHDGAYALLFTDSPAVLSGWRLISTPPSFMSIQRTVTEYQKEGFTPVGISATDDGQLAILFLGFADREPPVPIVVGLSKVPEETTVIIQSMVEEGWTPMSVTNAPTELVMLFLMF